ncbi:hypothetical protein [Vannielia sp. SX4]|uniref:hypothetical protein n=1 Tax=Vannielia sp. SX4 TaxID=3463852 RepID=UPI00405997B4
MELAYEHFFELQPEELGFQLLGEAGFFTGGYRPTAKLKRELKEHLNPEDWAALEREVDAIHERAESAPTDVFPPFDHCDFIVEILIVATWVQVFEEPLSDIWLAAMSLHAAHVRQDDFLYGYLTSLIHQRERNEEHFLRGKGTLEAARRGGESSAENQRSDLQKILEFMAAKISAGVGIAQAARLAAKAGLGASAEANRRIWYRHRRNM